MENDFYVAVFSSSNFSDETDTSSQFEYNVPKELMLPENDWFVGVTEFFHNSVRIKKNVAMKDIIKFNANIIKDNNNNEEELDLFSFIPFILNSMRSPQMYGNYGYFKDFTHKQKFPPLYPFVYSQTKEKIFSVKSKVRPNSSYSINAAYENVPKPTNFTFEIDTEYTLKQIIRLILQQTCNYIVNFWTKSKTIKELSSQQIDILQWHMENVYLTFIRQFFDEYKKFIVLSAYSSFSSSSSYYLKEEDIFLVLKADFVVRSNVGHRYDEVLFCGPSRQQNGIVNQISYIKVTKNIISKMKFKITDIFDRPIEFVDDNYQCCYVKLHFKRILNK